MSSFIDFLVYYGKIRRGESAYGEMVFVGRNMHWHTCGQYCKTKNDEGETFDAVTLSNLMECYCSRNSIRVANESRMMTFIAGSSYGAGTCKWFKTLYGWHCGFNRHI